MATTQISKRQLLDGIIDDAKVQAGAAIALSKISGGTSLIKNDGTVAMTGALNMGSQLITNVLTPSATTDAANKSYVDGLIAGLNAMFDHKDGARAGSTANVNIANPGTAVFDGVTLANGERILLKNQTAPAENGIYIFNGSGVAMTRALDMDAWTEVPGAVVIVQEGTTNADTWWYVTSNQGGTLGTTAITWVSVNIAGGGLTSSNFVDKETPAGTINGSNTTFTLANTPTAGSEHVFLNGQLQDVGAGNDYTISGGTITMLTAPLTGEKIRVSYRK